MILALFLTHGFVLGAVALHARYGARIAAILDEIL